MKLRQPAIDVRIVDLTRTGFMALGNIGNVN
jgi:hypothetical protein